MLTFSFLLLLTSFSSCDFFEGRVDFENDYSLIYVDSGTAEVKYGLIKGVHTKLGPILVPPEYDLKKIEGGLLDVYSFVGKGVRIDYTLRRKTFIDELSSSAEGKDDFFRAVEIALNGEVRCGGYESNLKLFLLESILPVSKGDAAIVYIENGSHIIYAERISSSKIVEFFYPYNETYFVYGVFEKL